MASDNFTQGSPFDEQSEECREHARGSLPALALGALGVVFGDIGTSPLYAVKQVFAGPNPASVDRLHIFGTVCLMFWSMVTIVTVKYVILILRNSSTSAFLALACGVLSGCHHAVSATNASAASGNVNENLTSRNFIDPDNFFALEDTREAAPLVPAEGMSWRWDPVRFTASFGHSPSSTAFSIECRVGRHQLIFHRFLGARGSSTGTMSFTGNGHVASLSAATTGDAGSQAGSWQAAAPTADLSMAVAKVFAGTAPVAIAVAGSTEFITSASPITQQPFSVCRH